MGGKSVKRPPQSHGKPRERVGPLTEADIERQYGKVAPTFTNASLSENWRPTYSKVQTSLTETLVLEGSSGFRQRLALALITNQRMRIEKFRIKDPILPGLRPSEACIIELAEKLGENVDIRIGGGHAYSEVKLFDAGIILGCEHGMTIDCPPDRGLTYYLEFLTMIAPFSRHGIQNLTLRGVTEHPLDLSIDSFRAGLIGTWKRCGKRPEEGPKLDIRQYGAEMPKLEVTINSRGLLPNGGGSVTLNCGIFQRKLGVLQPFKLIYPGRVCRVRGVAYTCHMTPMHATKCSESARGVLNHLLADVHVYTDIAKGSKAGESAGFGISLVAETLKGTFYTADAVVDKHHEKLDEENSPLAVLKTNTRDVDYSATSDTKDHALQSSFLGRVQLPELLKKHQESKTEQEPISEVVGREVALKLVAEIADMGAISSAFQWLGLYLAALADDSAKSILVLGRLTANSVLMLRNIRQFLGVEFDIKPFKDAVRECKIREYELHGAATAPVEECAQAEGDGSPSTPGVSGGGSKRGSATKEVIEGNQFVLSCRGIGFTNISRVTF